MAITDPSPTNGVGGISVRPIFLLLGAIAVGLAIVFRKDLFTAAKGISVSAAAGLNSATVALLQQAEKLPVRPTVLYNLLPPGPPEVGPLAPNKSLDDLDPAFKAKIPALEAELKAILKPHGITFARGETLRTWARQTYLYGIGRLYQAPGRSGTVTDAVTASGNHPKGKAIDFNYYKNGTYLTNAEQVRVILKPHAARLKATYGVSWGGTWRKPDVPHFEDA